MLAAESKKKLATPGLRIPGLNALPLGSKIALGILTIIGLAAIFAPLLAPFQPGATGLVPADKMVMTEVEIRGLVAG